MLIKLQTFLDNVQRIVDAKPTYELGHDGRDGKCDCIGLPIGAIRYSGGVWSGTHGSNYAARNAMQSVDSDFKMELGTIVYKAYLPGQKGWNLPEAYKDHPDQKDYYHVGVVIQVSPLRITHCTSSSTVNGIAVDTKIGVWRYGGRLSYIDYDNEEVPMEPLGKATVVAESGNSVRMRARPNNKAVILANIPIGTEVEQRQRDGIWTEIEYEERLGWMISKFLKQEAGTGGGTPGELSFEQKVDILWKAYTDSSGV